MSDHILDYFIMAVLGFSVLMFLTGNGDRLLELFGGNRDNSLKEYEHDKLMRASTILCIVLLVDELVLFFAGNQFRILGLISIIVPIAALAAYIFYIRKYARKK